MEQNDLEYLQQHPELCLTFARGICRRHWLPDNCVRMPDGSQPVFATASRQMIKIFSPQDREDAQNEALFLERLYRHLPVTTPRLDAFDEWEGYPYIVMEQLEGTPLNRLWVTLADKEKREIVCQLGEAACALHSLPVAWFDDAPFQWDVFIEHQRAALLENHQRFGLAPKWLAQLSDYMNAYPLDLQDPKQMAPLHTEFMLEHLFVKQEGTRWKVSGLIDFEPSMVGQREYDFCAVGIFITQGNSGLFREFLLSYGYADSDLTDDLRRRIMMWLLLHRYCNLSWFLTLIPGEFNVTKLEELERYWFGF
ncbi:predicted protein [Candidatus Moduliflexus flocculans]|uniref:Aminoglycoside phosphotransferase domain-containing protein n=1 Tax=Candidatus Moduliflexus flocculans TaxID=1499966 RepID=A0A0S6W5P6_9BACT|nr:predicted protein [Candidatus Moduliflexus flocculans]